MPIIETTDASSSIQTEFASRGADGGLTPICDRDITKGMILTTFRHLWSIQAS